MTRKIILYISQSLDGFIADQNGGVDWIAGNVEPYESDYGYEDFIQNVDTVICGATTYRQIRDELSPGQWPYETLQSYVLTHEKLEDTDNIHFVDTHFQHLIHTLQQQEGKAIWICGGANLIHQCMQADLIDEYQITTVPVLLGDGIRLFEKDCPRIQLKLESIREENGLILAVYQKQN